MSRKRSSLFVGIIVTKCHTNLFFVCFCSIRRGCVAMCDAYICWWQNCDMQRCRLPAQRRDAMPMPSNVAFFYFFFFQFEKKLHSIHAIFILFFTFFGFIVVVAIQNNVCACLCVVFRMCILFSGHLFWIFLFCLRFAFNIIIKYGKWMRKRQQQSEKFANCRRCPCGNNFW